MLKEYLKLFAEFFGCILSVVGFIAAMLFTILAGDYWFLSIAVLVLGYAAYPQVKKWFIDLKGDTVPKKDE